MNRPQLCLSDRGDQLLRWQESFPQGRIIECYHQLDQYMTSSTMVWLHLDCLTQENLIRICNQIPISHPTCKLIAITFTPESRMALECLKLGISGYCHALSVPSFFRQVEQVVSTGGYWLGEDLMQQLIGTIDHHLKPTEMDVPKDPLEQLSSREQEVALQVCRGAANKEIAQNLFISERTVKAHLSSIFQKLEVRDRLQLVLHLQNHY